MTPERAWGFFHGWLPHALLISNKPQTPAKDTHKMLPLAAATSQTLSPEFMGMLVLGIMQLGNFWFNAARNRRDEAAVTKAELKDVEARIERKIRDVEDRHAEAGETSRKEIREDFQNVFKQLTALKEGMAATKTQSELTSQKVISLETKMDTLSQKIIGKPPITR